MSRTHLIIPDTHAHPKHHNDRALWLGELIKDVKPDVVVHMGDSADMPSLSSYDKGKKSFQGRKYKDDIDAHLDFQEKMWYKVRKAKKRLPYRVFLHGNHEHRISRAVEISPELEDTIGYHDLQISEWYDEEVEYSGGTPGITCIDGIHYAHYFTSGKMGYAISGEHPAYTLLSKFHGSCTAAHGHDLDYSIRRSVDGRWMHGLIAGVYQDYDSDWAGNLCKKWWRGVVVKREVLCGAYEPQFISLETLRKEYS